MANRTDKVALKVKRRSGFDKSHFNLFTSLPGKITPIMLDEVIANTKINLRVNVAATMPPLVTDCYMKTDLCVEAFFVPLRILCKSFESWFTQQERTIYQDAVADSRHGYLPVAEIDLSLTDEATNKGLHDYFGIRGLPDYLGYRSSAYSQATVKINPLPFVAYHLVWQDWYRRQDVQKACFVDSIQTSDPTDSTELNFASAIPVYFFSDEDFVLASLSDGLQQIDYWKLADGVNLFEMRSRNFDSDYFTNALPRPQVGNGQSVQVVGNSFTIASLRAANSLQMFQEKNALAGTRFQDTLKVRYGANLSDGLAQRPVLLGAARYNVYNKGVYLNSNMPENAESQNSNPFGTSAGAQYGVAQASGSDFIIDGFTANEPGYILVNATLVPTVTYSSGCSRALIRYRSGLGSLAEMANPLLENTGNQPIWQSELNGRIGEDDDYVFGYTDRYADFKDAYDEIHGLFRSSMPLASFVSQRHFAYGSYPTINDNFLKIPADYLDDVLTAAVNESGTRFGYWAQVGFDYKVSMPLSEYSMPSLQDPAYEHGDTIVVHRGGFHF